MKTWFITGASRGFGGLIMEAALATDAVVTIADGMRDELTGFGIPASHVTVIPNAIDETQFTPMDADPALRARYGLGNRTVIGYISTLDSNCDGHGALSVVNLAYVNQFSRAHLAGVLLLLLILIEGPGRIVKSSGGKITQHLADCGLGRTGGVALACRRRCLSPPALPPRSRSASASRS